MNPNVQYDETFDNLANAATEAAKAINDVMDDLSDEVPTDEEDTVIYGTVTGATEPQQEETNQSQPPQEEAKKASKFINDFKDYISSDDFKQSINDASKQYKVPPKKLANNFFQTVLGTIGDALGTGIKIVGNAAYTLVSILTVIGYAGVTILIKVAKVISRVITLNYTCKPQCA